jgi:hypothetical protein
MGDEDFVQSGVADRTPGDDAPPYDTFTEDELEDFRERNWDTFPSMPE